MDTVIEKDRLGILNVIILILSVYILIALLIDTLFVLPIEISKILFYTDNLICAVFLYDFFIRFYRADNKLEFMKWGWIDLVSSIPAVTFFRLGRAIRIVRIFRLIRAFRSTKHLISYVFRNRAQGTLMSVFLIALLLVFFSSIAILQVENTPNSNIKTAEDALWWAYVTITTVGYGDKYYNTPQKSDS